MTNYPINKDLWYLNQNIKYLNHGSFGATPKVIMDKFFEFNIKLENNPMKFFLEDYPRLIHKSRLEISKYINAKANRVAFVENATTGVNAVLRSLQYKFSADWEILTTDHYYMAIKNALNYQNEVTGCKIKAVELPKLLESSEQIIDLLVANIGEKTKLLLIDHISSISGIIFPVKEIIEIFHQKGIPVLVDGAHAPGLLNLDIKELNPDWYVGNLHKWLFAPKGTAILYCSDEYVKDIHPASIANDYQKGFTAEFDWVGTRNICAWLTVPDCIKFHNEYFNYDYCRKLSLEVRDLFKKELNLSPLADKSLTGLMHSYYLPEKIGTSMKEMKELRSFFLNEHDIEIFINPFKERVVLRFSVQIYNYLEEYRELINSLKILIKN
jgi:isopenicillin-N epimerase